MKLCVRMCVHIQYIHDDKLYIFYAIWFSLLDASPPDDLPIFSTIPISLMFLNKGETVVAGCSNYKAIQGFPLAWGFENGTEFYFTGEINFKVEAFSHIPLSLYGYSNLLVNSSTNYNFHNVTYLCLYFSEAKSVSVPVTFFVYGGYNKVHKHFVNMC